MRMNIIIHLLRIVTLTSASLLLMFEDIAHGYQSIRKSADYFITCFFSCEVFVDLVGLLNAL